MNEPTSVINVTVALTPSGYRGVLLHLAALRLRLAVSLLAFFGFAALGAGFNTQSIIVFVGMVGLVVTGWGYIAWNVSSPSRIELYEPVAYEFGPEGIVYASPSGAGEIEWIRVPRWRYAAEHYLLYITGATYLLVPESDIPAPDRQRFEELLRARIRKSPKRRT